MDPLFIGTAVMTVLGPYLAKGGEVLTKEVSKDLYDKVKGFFKAEEDQKLLTAPEGKAKKISVEKRLKEILKDDVNALAELSEALALSDAVTFKLQNIYNSTVVLKEELAFLYESQNNAGIGTEGDVKNRIALQERKLEKLEKDFNNILLASFK